MSLDFSSVASPTPGGVRPPRLAGRLFLLFVVIAVTSVVAFGLAVVSYAKPLGDSEMPSYADIAPLRGYVWTFFLVAGVNLVIGVVAATVAGLVLTAGRRGQVWGTVGGGILTLGAALYGVGIGGWSVGYYLASDAATLGPNRAAKLVDQFDHDASHFLAVPITGAVLVAIGGIVLTVGIWRAGTMPRWILALVIVGGVAAFLARPDTIPGIAAEALSSATTTAVGWYAWRRPVHESAR